MSYKFDLNVKYPFEPTLVKLQKGPFAPNLFHYYYGDRQYYFEGKRLPELG